MLREQHRGEVLHVGVRGALRGQLRHLDLAGVRGRRDLDDLAVGERLLGGLRGLSMGFGSIIGFDSGIGAGVLIADGSFGGFSSPPQATSITIDETNRPCLTRLRMLGSLGSATLQRGSKCRRIAAAKATQHGALSQECRRLSRDRQPS